MPRSDAARIERKQIGNLHLARNPTILPQFQRSGMPSSPTRISLAVNPRSRILRRRSRPSCRHRHWPARRSAGGRRPERFCPAENSPFRAATRWYRKSIDWLRASSMWCLPRTGIRRGPSSVCFQPPGRKPYEAVDLAYGARNRGPIIASKARRGRELHRTCGSRMPRSFCAKAIMQTSFSIAAFYEERPQDPHRARRIPARTRLGASFVVGLAFDFACGFLGRGRRARGFDVAAVFEDGSAASTSAGRYLRDTAGLGGAGISMHCGTGNDARPDESWRHLNASRQPRRWRGRADRPFAACGSKAATRSPAAPNTPIPCGCRACCSARFSAAPSRMAASNRHRRAAAREIPGVHSVVTVDDIRTGHSRSLLRTGIP